MTFLKRAIFTMEGIIIVGTKKYVTLSPWNILEGIGINIKYCIHPVYQFYLALKSYYQNNR